MSYDFSISVDTGGTEPHYIDCWFSDVHPALDKDGMAGTAVLTESGYSRCGNYTSNVSGMWTKCLTAAAEQHPETRALFGNDARKMIEKRPDLDYYRDNLSKFEKHLSLRDLAGENAGTIAPLLKTAVEWGIEHLDELREMNPENGWGNAEGAVTYLWDIQRACEQNPKGTLYISS